MTRLILCLVCQRVLEEVEGDVLPLWWGLCQQCRDALIPVFEKRNLADGESALDSGVPKMRVILCQQCNNVLAIGDDESLPFGLCQQCREIAAKDAESQLD